MIDCDRYRSQQGRFRKALSGFFGEIVKDQSKIIFQVIFHIDRDFSNSKK